MDVIRLSCTCGHSLKFAAANAGKKAKCPKCKTVLTIPAAEKAAEKVNGPAAAAAEDEGDGAYGVVVDHDLEARRQRLEEEEQLRQKELRKKKAPKVQKKFKSLPEAEAWEKVQFGLLFVFFGTCLWALTHLLQGMWVGLGTAENNDYSRLVTELIERSQQARVDHGDPPIPEDGRFWEFSQFHMLVAMAGGRGFVSFAKFCLVVNLFLYPIQAILWAVGFILCFPVPRHHGTLGLLITFLVLGFFNFLFFFFFRLLPTTGLYRYYLVPYVIPEVLITEYNMDRLYPFFLLWSPSPFWESLLSIFLQFIYYLQPIIAVMFLWACATALKDIRVEENSNGVVVTGLGQYFLWLSLLMISLCGTSPVLVWVLRILYIMWYAFQMMFIIRFALLTWRVREMLEARINPESQ
jgi:hypothetical protein